MAVAAIAIITLAITPIMPNGVPIYLAAQNTVYAGPLSAMIYVFPDLAGAAITAVYLGTVLGAVSLVALGFATFGVGVAVL